MDIQWAGSRFKQVSVKSLIGNAFTLQYGDQSITLMTQPGQTYRFDGTMKVILAK